MYIFLPGAENLAPLRSLCRQSNYSAAMSLTSKCSILLSSAVEVNRTDLPFGTPIRIGSHACDFCRVKKVRCMSNNPCSNCIKHGVQCNFTARRRRQTRKRDELPCVSQRLDRIEDMFDTAGSSGHVDGQLTSSKVMYSQ